MAVAVGIDEIIVGALDIVSDASTVLDTGLLDAVTCEEELEAAMLEILIVVEDTVEDVFWKPTDAANVETDEKIVVGGAIESVLLRVNLRIDDVVAGVMRAFAVTDFDDS